jgi:hypothetical protein
LLRFIGGWSAFLALVTTISGSFELVPHKQREYWFLGLLYIDIGVLGGTYDRVIDEDVYLPFKIQRPEKLYELMCRENGLS